MKLDDRQIRMALKERLTSYKDCYVYDEFTVPSGKARADLVAINGHFTGYEIKSDLDSFQRLSSQVDEYDRVFEKNFVVVGQKYEKKVEEFVPNHWGIIVVKRSNKGKITIEFSRNAKLNPNFSFYSFICLLSSNDLKYLVKETPHFLERYNYNKTQIQGLMKENIVDILNLETTKVQKGNIKKIVRLVFKHKNIRNIYKNGTLL